MGTQAMVYPRGRCPACESRSVVNLREIDGYDYFQCRTCQMLFIDSSVLNEIDEGSNITKYDAEYWQMKVPDAKERAYGVALARTAEVIYYTRTPIERFIDIVAGPGY